MTEMTGGTAIVKSLIHHDIDTVFGVPGIQLDGLYNAFYDEKNAIRVMNTRHEQGAAYMAFGYAQSTGRVGTYAVVPGPGLLNTTAALSTAYACSAPVLAITGQVPSKGIGKELGLLHEIRDQLGLIRHLTKWAERIDSPAEAPATVAEAFRQLRTGRPQPVEIEMAMDLLHKTEDVSLIGETPAYDPPPDPDPDAVERAAKALGEAENPVIFVGLGAQHAGEHVVQLAEMLQAPIVSQRGGRGAVSDRNPFMQPWPAGHHFWKDADVVIGVGSRVQQARMAWGWDEDMTLIKIDIDEDELNRGVAPEIGILSDSVAALNALIPALEKHNRSRPSRKDEMEKIKADLTAEFKKLQPQYDYLMAIRDELPEDGFYVDELTQVGYVARFALPIYQPRTFVGPGYQGTLGYGFATALGVQVANPDRKVISINGDGGFMFTMQELSTMAKYNIPLVAIIFADGAFGNVKRMQKDDYDGRVIATDLKNPDFVQLAELFGIQGLRAEGAEQLRQAIRKGFDSGAPTVIEVPMPEDVPEPWDYIHLPKIRGK